MKASELKQAADEAVKRLTEEAMGYALKELLEQMQYRAAQGWDYIQIPRDEWDSKYRMLIPHLKSLGYVVQDYGPRSGTPGLVWWGDA